MPKILYPNNFPEYIGIQNCAKDGEFPESIVGPRGLITYGLSLRDAMLFIWRIKKWTLTLPSGFGFAETTTTAETEPDIFCGPLLIVEGEVNYSTEPLSEPQIEAQFSIGYGPQVYRRGDLYYPDFTMSYNYAESFNDEPVSFIQSASQYDENAAFEFEIPIANSPLPPVKMWASEYFGSPPIGAISSISEYWSYGGTWDTQTGARL